MFFFGKGHCRPTNKLCWAILTKREQRWKCKKEKKNGKIKCIKGNIMFTNKSSCDLKNSVSDAAGSQSTSCSSAISFRSFSFLSGEGARTDSSSINCRYSQKCHKEKIAQRKGAIILRIK
ncbi:LOW QUALITY PROTEIN: hypothetical protein TorRG33x02_040490 [Trema orientale]|uniref:Uncharacterized protein n=1 Tax=Trema orientale TaxID=63057 RepID=A0A2P5FR79_TREOI|nr:LOW QUALITY PROTEIN: hypothetical protein TorRG33x02_040490 [Trema orientale]